MRQAIALAEEAAAAGEVPVGCVIVQDGLVVGRGRNRREEKRSALSHAETEAIAQANAALSPCAPGPSSTPASGGCTSGPGTGAWGPAAG